MVRSPSATASANPDPLTADADLSDIAAWLRLTLVPGLGPAQQRKLLSAFGLPQQIFDASRGNLAAVVGNEAADLLSAPANQPAIDIALAWAAEDGNHILTLADAAYPRALLDITDPPSLLYAKGNPDLLDRPALAIVGARSATPQGEENAHAFARHLCSAGLTIVSGLALGIDAAAHRGALADEAAATIAVIGTGADRIYPARNASLAREIAARGVILSEFPLGSAAQRHHFPRRNRLIAGLSLGVLVVEAAIGSGSLITARLATEGGLEVFAIPGSIHSPLSRGCHRLIREGAKLVETAEDILEELRPRLSLPLTAQTATATRPSPPLDEGDEASRRLLSALGHDPVDIDTLALRCGLTVDALYAMLLAMELDGRIARLPGNRFQRL